MKKSEYTHPTGVKTLIICLLVRPDALPLSYRGHVGAKGLVRNYQGGGGGENRGRFTTF